MGRAWMPLYVGDYLGDTGHLTTAQHGAYLLLMMHYWRKGELPDDDRQLSKITKLPLKTWSDYRPVLQQFFHSGSKIRRKDGRCRKQLLPLAPAGREQASTTHTHTHRRLFLRRGMRRCRRDRTPRMRAKRTTRQFRSVPSLRP